MGYMESHDEERMMYKADEWGAVGIKGDKSVQLDRAGLCAAFSMLIPGPKMIWQFGELGYDYSIDYNGRVGRKPVRWDYLEDSDRNDLYQEYSYLLAVSESYPHLFDTSVDASLTPSTSNFGSAR